MNKSDKTPHTLAEIMCEHINDKPKDFGNAILKERMYPASTVEEIAKKYAILEQKRLSWEEVDTAFTKEEGCAESLRCEKMFKWFERNYYPPIRKEK